MVCERSEFGIAADVAPVAVFALVVVGSTE